MSRAKVKFKLNKAGVRELLKSEGAQRECEEYAYQIYNQVSDVDGYEVKKQVYPERIGYGVAASEYPAIADNLKNNSLARAGKV